MRTTRFMLVAVVVLTAVVAVLMYGTAVLSQTWEGQVDWASWTEGFLALLPITILTGGFYGLVLAMLTFPLSGRRA